MKTTADSGNPRVQAFCPKCGSPIYSTTPGEGQQASYMVRVGILEQRDQLAPKKQNWFRSARTWVTGMDGIHKNEKQALIARKPAAGRPTGAALPHSDSTCVGLALRAPDDRVTIAMRIDAC